MRTFLEDARHGRFLLIRGDFISDELHRRGEWSETEIELFRCFLSSGSNVVEVGANIGAHTVPIARMCSRGTVVVFEVQRPIFYVLGANLAMNNCINVVGKLSAAWDCTETLKIETCWYDAAWNYGNFSVERGFSDENRFHGARWIDHVGAVRLDADPHIGTLTSLDLLKIDAEGAELRVLEGARRTIEAHKPAVFMEANRRSLLAEVRSRLESLGYDGYWFVTIRGRPDSYFGPADYSDGLSSRMEENAIFVHRDRPWRPAGLRRMGAEPTPPADLPVLHKYPLPPGEAPMFVFGTPQHPSQ